MRVGGAHLLAQRAPAALRRAMPVVSVIVRPDGLHPIEAIKAWHKRTCEGFTVDKILAEGALDVRTSSCHAADLQRRSGQI